MKRLFQITTNDGPIYFGDKVAAKETRDKLNNGKQPNEQVCVSRGPDHALFGIVRSPRTHSHRANSGGAGTGFPKKRR